MKNVYYKDLAPELAAEMWARFRDGIAPIRQSGKSAAVHFQFAPRVAFHPKNFEHVEECQEELAGYQLSIEFHG